MPENRILPLAQSFIKKLFYRTLSSIGYKLTKSSKAAELYVPLHAARNLLKDWSQNPVIFDVGANVGQTSKISRKLFPNAIIHSFEPGTDAFRQLSENLGKDPLTYLHNMAVGSTPGLVDLNENTLSTMSSVLPMGSVVWGSIKAVRSVEMTTVDQVAQKNNIDRITILKSDTQGYDLEVLRGAAGMMEGGKIDCVFFEIIFSDLYQGMPRFDKTIGYLMDRGFVLAGIYDIHYKDGIAAWADALFIHSRCLESRFASA